MAAVARAAALMASIMVLAGCGSDPPQDLPPLGADTRLAATTTSGSAEVGSFRADAGDLWIGGRCSGGDLQVIVHPVAELPIPCRALAGEPFLNQIVMARSTEVTVSVTAPDAVTWDLRVHQRPTGG